jgi:hypothetical protein
MCLGRAGGGAILSPEGVPRRIPGHGGGGGEAGPDVPARRRAVQAVHQDALHPLGDSSPPRLPVGPRSSPGNHVCRGGQQGRFLGGDGQERKTGPGRRCRSRRGARPDDPDRAETEVDPGRRSEAGARRGSIHFGVRGRAGSDALDLADEDQACRRGGDGLDHRIALSGAGHAIRDVHGRPGHVPARVRSGRAGRTGFGARHPVVVVRVRRFR